MHAMFASGVNKAQHNMTLLKENKIRKSMFVTIDMTYAVIWLLYIAFFSYKQPIHITSSSIYCSLFLISIMFFNSCKQLSYNDGSVFTTRHLFVKYYNINMTDMYCTIFPISLYSNPSYVSVYSQQFEKLFYFILNYCCIRFIREKQIVNISYFNTRCQ